MPQANGAGASSAPTNAPTASLLPGHEALPFAQALDVLHRDYPQRDGIDAATLLDSAKNAGLTYNDFLVLPGYIGERRALPVVSRADRAQASPPPTSPSTPPSPSASPSRRPSCRRPWTR